MSWADQPCSGPYVNPCISYADDRVNLRLYQWCPQCLVQFSKRLNHEPLIVNAPVTVHVDNYDELARRWDDDLHVEDRAGKYYGTVVCDRVNNEVIKFWTATGEPSPREKRRFGDWSQAAWDDYVSDSHWECEADFKAAVQFVALAKSLRALAATEKQA